MTEWNVYFSGNFWGHDKRERKCREIPVNKSFHWGEEAWKIPAIYTGRSGMVVDFCVEISSERIEAFMDKWDLWDGEERERSNEERMQMESGNPLQIDIHPQIVLNGRRLRNAHSCSVSWNPCFGNEACASEAKEVLEHYECNPRKGWVFIRSAFQWKTKNKPVIRNMELILEQKPVLIPGPHFTADAPGEKTEFTHPITGVRHTLTVIDNVPEKMKMDRGIFDKDMEWPEHYRCLRYTLSPDLSDGEFMIQDCADSDSPRQKKKNSVPLAASSKDASIAIIGGADGPTAIFFACKNPEKFHEAYSSLHFEPVEKVEWRIGFYEKQRRDITVEI